MAVPSLPLYLVAVVLLLSPFSLPSSALTPDSISDPSTAADVAGKFLSDASQWLWPSSEDPQSDVQIHSMLQTWCGDTYTDAVRLARERGAEVDRLKGERDNRLAEAQACSQGRAAREREMEAEFERARQTQANAVEREKSLLRSECAAATNLLRDDLEACELKIKKKDVSICRMEVSKAEAACVQSLSDIQANLTACASLEHAVNSSAAAHTAVQLTTCNEALGAAGLELKELHAELARCRPARAQAESRLKALLSDGTAASLQDRVHRLQALLMLAVLMLGAAVAAAAFMYKHVMEKSFPQVLASTSFASLVTLAPPRSLRILTSEQAQETLRDTYERQRGALSLNVIVTASSNASTLSGGKQGGNAAAAASAAASASGTHAHEHDKDGSHTTVYVLIPVNTASSRRFSLFGAGGDFSSHLEKAQEMVSRSLPKARVYVVLYEATGCVFTDATLHSLRLSADKICHEAYPHATVPPTPGGTGQDGGAHHSGAGPQSGVGGDFPLPQSHLLTLWLDRQEGLRVSDAEKESELSDSVREEAWAQYLLTRSGRWGMVHAQMDKTFTDSPSYARQTGRDWKRKSAAHHHLPPRAG